MSRPRLIEAHVLATPELPQHIKEFVQEQSISHHSPFRNEEPPVSRIRNKGKRSLTDWRLLYHNHNKIGPAPTTPAGTRSRGCPSGQCTRYKPKTASSQIGHRTFWTRQSRRDPSDPKQNTMVEFALAQTLQQKEAMGPDEASIKEKRLRWSKAFQHQRSDIAKVGAFLSSFGQGPASERDLDVTGQYLRRLKEELRLNKIKDCNWAKIRDSNKINNEHLFERNYLRKKSLETNNGLRYYERA